MSGNDSVDHGASSSDWPMPTSVGLSARPATRPSEDSERDSVASRTSASDVDARAVARFHYASSRSHHSQGSATPSLLSGMDEHHEREDERDAGLPAMSVVSADPSGYLPVSRPFIVPPFLIAATQTSVDLGIDRRRETQRLLGAGPSDSRNANSYGAVRAKRAPSSESGSSSEADGTEESTSSGGSSEEELALGLRLPRLTGRQWATVGMLAVANFCSTVAFSCIAPFYPAEAQQKGMDASQTGIVFGAFELAMFIFAPLLGKYMIFIGSRVMFSAGLAVTGVTAILFGSLPSRPLPLACSLLNGLPSGPAFFWASLVIRCAEAVGDAAFSTSSFAISAKCFPRSIGTVVGIMETFAGLGYTAGPLIGGVLYDYGGFQLPFFVLGVLLLVAAALSCFLIEQFQDEPLTSSKGMMGIVKIPVVWVMIFAIISCALSLSFLDPTLADHLSSFGLSTTLIGVMFLLCGGIYTITAPFWGLLIDRFDCSRVLLYFGAIATTVAMLAIGPTPLLHFDKNLWLIGIALAVLGVAAGALYIPTFQNCLDAVREAGYDDSFQTYGCVSGVFQSAFAFGAFLGPTLGGMSVLWIGFPWTTTVIAAINVIFLVTLASYSTWKAACCSRRESEYRSLVAD